MLRNEPKLKVAVIMKQVVVVKGRGYIYVCVCVCRLKAEGAISLGGAASCGGGRPPSALTCIIL